MKKALLLMLTFACLTTNVNAKKNPSDMMGLKGVAQNTPLKDDEHQKDSLKADFLEFDGPNAVNAFKKTCQDMSVIEGIYYSDHLDSDGIHYKDHFVIKITYPDGTVFRYIDVLRHLHVTSAFKEAIYPLKKVPGFYDVKILLDPIWTMDARAISGRKDEEKWISGMQGRWVFPDGMIIDGGYIKGSIYYNHNGFFSKYYYNPSTSEIECHINEPDYLDLGEYEADIITPANDNGDYAIIGVCKEKYNPSAEQKTIGSFKKTFPDCSVMAEGSPINDESFEEEFSQDFWFRMFFNGAISYNNGGSFKGVFTVHFTSSIPEINSDKRIQALGAKIIASLDNMKLGNKYDGKEYDSDGNLIAIYKAGKILDEFDLQIELLKEKEERDRKEAALRQKQAEKEEYENECNKYGKKYVDAWRFNGRILVGTPEEYFLDKVGKVQLYHESQYTRAYRVYTLGGNVGLYIDVNVKTKKVTRVYDVRNQY